MKISVFLKIENWIACIYNFIVSFIILKNREKFKNVPNTPTKRKEFAENEIESDKDTVIQVKLKNKQLHQRKSGR